jgi:hypothetical protein
LAGNQIAHETAMQEAKNTLEAELLADRIEADVNAAETLHRNQMGYTDADGDIVQGEIDKRYANDLALAAQQGADSLERVNTQIDAAKAAAQQGYELQVGYTDERGVTHKGTIEILSDMRRAETEIAGVQDRALESLRFAQEVGLPIEGFEGVDVYLDQNTGGLTADSTSAVTGEPNVLVGENGSIGRMGVQLANDLVKIEVDTQNRLALTIQEYASKTELSAAEHTQFLDALSEEYGLKQESQEFIDRSANYRAELAAETTRLAADLALDESAVKMMSSLEETQMEQWVEINKMVFDPDDPTNDAAIRQEAINALNGEYADRKVLIADTVTQLTNFDWSVSVSTYSETGQVTTADNVGYTEPSGLLSTQTPELYPSTTINFSEALGSNNDEWLESNYTNSEVNADLRGTIYDESRYEGVIGSTINLLKDVSGSTTFEQIAEKSGATEVWGLDHDSGSWTHYDAARGTGGGNLLPNIEYRVYSGADQIGVVTKDSVHSGSITTAINDYLSMKD